MMKNTLFLIAIALVFSITTSAQEGRAQKPLAETRCEASAGESVENCYFKEFRFTTIGVGEKRQVKIARMESGSYVVTSIERIFKSPEKAVSAINASIMESINKLRETSRNACLNSLAQSYALSEIAFSFDKDQVFFALPYNAKCNAASEIKIGMPLREFDRLLK